ncbi:MAG: isoleucine--tRNA ligase [Candidatus Microgenomates bacterium]
MFKLVEENHNFIEMEHKWLKSWYENGIVDKYLKKNKDSDKYFSFLDGPITANNPMGVHHAWGRTYKDLWPKFYNLLGYKQRFQNGFDCQGLWVEVEVEKELGLKSKKDIENLVPGDKFASIAKFVDLCKQRVYRFSKIQTEQSKRLGYFADWQHSYFTMADENNYMIWTFLKKCADNGWIYKGQESVPWCPRCQTAISQHEMLTEDYKEVVHESIYFKLKIKNPKFEKEEYLLVWTTTPWTLLANIAVAVEKKYEYSLVEVKTGEKYWLAKDLVKIVLSNNDYKVIKTVKGEELVGLEYEGPFDNLEAVKKVSEDNPGKFHIVIATDENIMPISLVEGTGLVHTAVSAGTEDYKLGKKLGLPMIPVIDDQANYLDGLGEFSGKNAKKNPRIILDYMEKNGYAFMIHNYKHRYPACWRCKTELVWKVAEEWYIAMDKPAKNQKSEIRNQKLENKTLRERMIEVAKTIKWMPEFGLDRELDWLKNMHDWLISKKNRFWGLSLPIYECKNCGHFEVIGSKEELKEKAVEGWQDFEGHSPHKPYIDKVKIKCPKCGQLVSRIDDVGNPWLDAGIVAYSTIKQDNQGEPLYKIDKEKWRKWFPADFITESFPGQFKNWFYALIAMSTVMENERPFKRVLGYGTLLGEDGRPMHKSWGNAIEFNEGADKIGVDVMRWMFARQNPSDNMLFGYKKADEVRRQFYFILWNVYKFFIEYINLDKFNVRYQDFFDSVGAASQSRGPKSQKNLISSLNDINILDRWILSRLVATAQIVENNLKNFNAKDAALELEKLVSDLSTWYIRRSRDRVWVNSEDNDDKKAFYQTLYFVLVNLSVILSPFIPFLTEEIYTNLTGNESVHLEFWPRLDETIIDKDLEDQMVMARKIVELGHSKRKELKIKVRMPLLKLDIEYNEKVDFIKKDIWKIVADELNVKNIYINGKLVYPENEVVVSNEELEYEGRLREFIRQVQMKRKQLKLKPGDYFQFEILDEFKKSQTFLKRKLMIK